jgi:hypothetical protein
MRLHDLESERVARTPRNRALRSVADECRELIDLASAGVEDAKLREAHAAIGRAIESVAGTG